MIRNGTMPLSLAASVSPQTSGVLIGGEQQAALVGVNHPIQSGAELLETVDQFDNLGALRAQGADHAPLLTDDQLIA
ncbi:hypothetical protein [Micromonospora cathayae]|uniref:Uncharacterized protein n=1 Tax=Micromonospora cathayae TaxID=3028804 RepID=A0ABY7ZJC5_9ACTN|nr:hypothetical protein [Micromonospora sp. HUAS 3]WDZ83092.1 hypothetical protein PVK37_21825 [Micromonospora sp. HUAS 3]